MENANACEITWQEPSDHPRPAGVPQLVEHELLEVRVDVEDALHVHVGLEALLDAPRVGRDALDVLTLVVVSPDHHCEVKVKRLRSNSTTSSSSRFFS